MHGEDRIVGRSQEREALLRAFDAARRGSGRLAVVSGEAGSGKSALVRTVTDAMRAHPVVFAISAATPYAEGATLMPCLRAIGMAAPDGAAAPPWQLEVLATLARCSASKPVVWVIEDLHDADADTLDLLLFLARPIEALSVVVLTTVRTPFSAAADDPASPRVARLRRLALDIELHPLPAEDAVQLAARLLRRQPSDAEKEHVLRYAAGNPLFIEHCVASMKTGRPLASSRALQEIVIARLGALPSHTAQLLRWGALLGATFTSSLLGSVADALPAVVIDHLEPALRSGLLVEQEPGRFAFAHGLVHEAIRELLPRSERADVHLRAAAVLAQPAGGVAARAERAHHLLSAAMAGAAGVDLEAVREAIRALDAAGASDRAFALQRRLRQAQSLGAAPPAPPGELLTAAELARRAGAVGQARKLCLEALELSDATVDARTFAEAALALGADTVAAQIDPVLRGALERALATLPPAERGLRLRIEARLAAALQPAAEPEGPVRMAREAIAGARALGDEQVLSDALYFGGAALTDYVPADELYRAAEELLALAERRGDRGRALRAYCRLALASGVLGDFSRLDRAVDRAAALGADAPPAQRWRPLLLQSMRTFMRGGIAASERLCVEAERLQELVDDRALVISLSSHRLHQESIVGRRGGSRDALEPIRRHVDELGVGRTTAAAICAFTLARWRERAMVAAELATLPAELPRRLLLCDFPMLAEAYALAGSTEQRQAALAGLADYPYEHVFGGHVPLSYEGPIDRLRGLLEVSLGKEEGLASLRAAVEICESADLRTWEARTRLELVESLEHLGHRAAADAERRRARELCEDLGLAELALRLDSSDGRHAIVANTTAVVSMSLEAGLWVLAWGERVVRLPDSRGMQILARLVERQGDEVHVLALAGEEGALTDADAGPVLDARAMRSYRRRLEHVAAELAGGADLRRSQLMSEARWIEKQLAGATGLGGRARRVGSLAERARTNVQRRLKDAVRRVSDLDPVLGARLQRALRTGTYCTFCP